MFAAIILIVASISIIIAIFVLKRRNLITYEDWGRLIFLRSLDEATKQRLKKLDYGAKVLTGISFFFFVAWIEYTMWPYPYAERVVEIGQWGQLISTLLVLAFAAYKYILDPEGQDQEPTPAPQPSTVSVVNGKMPAETTIVGPVGD
jgi:hypothetical protein